MNKLNLFKSSGCDSVTNICLFEELLRAGAADCDVLFIHSSMNIGIPNLTLGRTGLFSEIWNVLLKLKVPTICVPTFTFSFPNGVDYDIAHSPTPMGALNEYVRRLPETTRSTDPIMSVALVGKEDYLIKDIGKYSCGPGSTFDLLHRRKGGVKFLFLGVRCFECFTFTHFVESEKSVPFRYHRPFTGKIHQERKVIEDTYYHYARYNGVKATSDDKFERYLESTGRITKSRLGDSWMSIVDEEQGYVAMKECLEKDPFYLAAKAYDPSELADSRFLEQNITTL